MFQMGPHDPAEFGQMGVSTLAVEQQAAQLLLEQLDGAGQRRLGDVALLGRAGEVELVCHRQKIADLMHLHLCPSWRASPDRLHRMPFTAWRELALIKPKESDNSTPMPRSLVPQGILMVSLPSRLQSAAATCADRWSRYPVPVASAMSLPGPGDGSDD